MPAAKANVRPTKTADPATMHATAAPVPGVGLSSSSSFSMSLVYGEVRATSRATVTMAAVSVATVRLWSNPSGIDPVHTAQLTSSQPSAPMTAPVKTLRTTRPASDGGLSSTR